MQTLGKILLAKGWATRSQIERAQTNQATIGGGLDTCLLEMGAVSEEQLLEALGRSHQLPAVDVETLRDVPEDVFKLLPKRVAQRCAAVPFEAMGTSVKVAMKDPRDLSCQDEVAFATGKRIEVHVSSEVRIAEALERYYGVERSSRLSTLAEQLNRARFLWRDRDKKPASAADRAEGFGATPLQDAPPLPGVGSVEPARKSSPSPETSSRAASKSPGQVPVARPKSSTPTSVQLTDEESQRLSRSGRRPKPSDAPSSEELDAAFDEATRKLQGARERDTVGRALLYVADRVFDRTALLAVRRNQVEGWMAGPRADVDRFEELSMSLDEPSVFLNLSRGIPFHLGPLPDNPVHRSLLAIWNGEMPEGAFLQPIRLKDRLVAVLYGDRRQAPPGSVPTRRFQELADQAAAALERCIMLKKKGMA